MSEEYFRSNVSALYVTFSDHTYFWHAGPHHGPDLRSQPRYQAHDGPRKIDSSQHVYQLSNSQRYNVTFIVQSY